MSHTYVILAVFCLCLATVVGQRTPTISYISQEQIKDMGDTVELECSVQYAQEYPVLWVKTDRTGVAGSLPISSEGSLVMKDGRFAVGYDTARSTSTLQIKDIQEADAGIYQCQVIISRNNKITADVDLLVRRPPVISDNSTSSLIVIEGQQVTLECYASGYPTPRILWRRENNAILPTGGSVYRGNILKIAAIRKEDRGTYYCVAENGVGKGARRNIAVRMEFAPVITVLRPRLGQALQHDMDLTCHVEAYPPPAILWTKDGLRLTNNQHYSISNFATADELMVTALRVITIEEHQYGTYVCKAINKLGSADAEVQLFGSGQRTPNITYISQEQIKDIGEDVQLECRVQSLQDYPVMWTKVDRTAAVDPLPISKDTSLMMGDSRIALIYDAESATYTLQIRNIEESDAGVYQCQVVLGSNDKITADVSLQIRGSPMNQSVTLAELKVTVDAILEKLKCLEANVGGIKSTLNEIKSDIGKHS